MFVPTVTRIAQKHSLPLLPKPDALQVLAYADRTRQFMMVEALGCDWMMR